MKNPPQRIGAAALHRQGNSHAGDVRLPNCFQSTESAPAKVLTVRLAICKLRALTDWVPE
jgi:hypothetical protein